MSSNEKELYKFTENSFPKLIQEIGPTCLHSPATLKSLIQQNQIQVPQEKDVALALCWIVRTSADPSPPTSLWGAMSHVQTDRFALGHKWETKHYVQALNELVSKLDWTLVIKNLDVPEFYISDAHSFEVFILTFKHALGSLSKFPIDLFWKKWVHMKGQISFLRWAAQSSRDIFDLLSLSQKHILTIENISSAPPTTRSIANSWVQQPWNSLELISTLIMLAEEEKDDDAKQLLDLASRQSTEMVLLGLVQMKQPWSKLHSQVVSKLVAIFLVGHSSSTFVLTRVWQSNPQLVIDAMLLLHQQDQNSLSRILDVAQELKALNHLLDLKTFNFTIDLAALASRREYLNLEKWLNDALQTNGDSFIQAVIEFLSLKVSQLNRPDQSVIPLSEEIFSIFFNTLNNYSKPLSANQFSLLKEVHSLALQTMPNLPRLKEDQTNTEASFKPEIEEEANSYYEKIYTGSLTIQNAIELLKKFHGSNQPHDQEIFACMVHNLFDEYRFFSQYPEKQLLVTAELFGSLIKHQLLSPVRLALALRHILDSLRHPLGSKMFRFGFFGLLQFQNRLSEWPQYCTHLLQISHLFEAHPEIAKMIQQALKIASSQPHNTEQPPQQPQQNNSSFTSLNVETLVKAGDRVDFETPNEAIQDKILFIINNISVQNIETKIKELKSLLQEVFHQWFSKYLVINRVAIEPNFHQLYISVLDHLARKALTKAVLNETFSNIKVLLSSEKTATSSQERTLLKNLGSWLGRMTLARNQPIKHKDLAMKQLLIESFRNSRLIVVIPFVCKVLEQCKESSVFRPPNPWLMALLRLLSELYHFADLKLNLKFEIEVMCKNIDVELKDIEPSGLLFGSENYDDLQNFNQHPPPTSLQPPMASMADSGPQIVLDETGGISVPNLAAFVSFSGNAPLFNAHPALKKIVLLAMDRTIREIIPPIIERSVSIAVVTTRELILKDFSSEPNEEKMRRASQLMVQNLAGNLAMVTSKDPFSKCFATNLRTALLQSGVAEPMIEVILSSVVAENIELGSLIVEKAAMEKSIPEINEALAHAFLARRRQRERGMPWIEVPQYNHSRFPAVLPEYLRLRQNYQPHLRVYEDFYRTGSRVPNSVGSALGPIGARTHSPQPIEDQLMNPLQQIMDKISALLNELDNIIQKNADVTLATLPQNHDIITLVRQINVAASQFFVRDELALWFSQKLTELLFKSEILLGIEIYIILLERICELSKRVAKEFTTWLLFAMDDKKFNLQVIVALIQSGLMNILEYDVFLAKELELNLATDISKLPAEAQASHQVAQEKLMQYAIQLCHKCLCSQPASLTQSELFYTLALLSKVQPSQVPASCQSLYEELKQKTPGLFTPPDDDLLSMKEQPIILFNEWIRIYQSPAGDEEDFLRQLQEKRVLEDEDNLMLFFRCCCEMSLEAYWKLRGMPNGPALSFQILDAFAALLKHLLERNDLSSLPRLDLFTRMTSVIVLVMVYTHEIKRTIFDPRPFHRLLSSLVKEVIQSQWMQQEQDQWTECIGNLFYLIRPQFLPGFVYSWLELISNRHFIPFLLLQPEKKGWPMFHKLFLEIFKFLSPFLRHAEMTDPIRVLYKGALRILLLLLHDFPEFLCEYHFSFCDVIPPSCIQLRNLILSAFPRDMRLPDPFTPNLKIDLLPEINKKPQMMTDCKQLLIKEKILPQLDQWLKSRQNPNWLQTLKSQLLLAQPDVYVSGTNYNVPLINALVFYAALESIQQMPSITQTALIVQSPAMELYKYLCHELDTEGRYHLLNAMANHLRYPNSHTHYFSCVLLYLFAESQQEIMKEQMTRVLLERLIVNRPHPWGLLITFIELLKNPRFGFWQYSFVSCAPDIERLFESVARSCMLGSGSQSNGMMEALSPPVPQP